MIELTRRGILGLLIGLFIKPKLSYSKNHCADISQVYLDIENHGKDSIYLTTLHIEEIVLETSSRWINPELVRWLEEDIWVNGLINPLEVVLKEGQYRLVGGYHRYMALKNTGVKAVIVQVFIDRS